MRILAAPIAQHTSAYNELRVLGKEHVETAPTVSVNFCNVEAGGRKEIAQQDAPLVGRLVVDGAQAPLADELAVFERADGDVAVARVES